MHRNPLSSHMKNRIVKFIPFADDEENLWEVLEIIGEQTGWYQVKWAGKDPTTGKTWAPSWVPKVDCTDDLKEAWMTKQAKAEAGKEKTMAKKKKSTKGDFKFVDSRLKGILIYSLFS
jgi:hypothetical protein